MEQRDGTIEVFCCYAHKDEAFLNELKMHLISLQKQKIISVWEYDDISAGTEWDQEIKEHLNRAQLILLLISPDFINSDYSYNTEMKHAFKRHEQKEARVISIIVRPTGDWENVPIGQSTLGALQALPTGAKPVTNWGDRDLAWEDVVKGIKKAINKGIKKATNDELLTREFAQNLRNDVSPSLPTNRVGQTSEIAEQSGRTEQVSQLTAPQTPLNRTGKHILKRVTTRRIPLLVISALIVLIVLIGGIIAYGLWHLPATISLASVKNLNIPCLSSRDSGRYIGPGCGTVLPLELTLTEIDTTHDSTIWHFKLALLQGTNRQCLTIAFTQMELTDEGGISYPAEEQLEGLSWSFSYGQSQSMKFTFGMHPQAGNKYTLKATIQACSVNTVYEAPPIPT